MEINQVIKGFKVVNKRQVPEIKAEVYEMVHEKTNAQLMWLDRDDDNKSFGIAFRTTPVDDTGVFHILEHSVLNGSKKFPLKEPFVDLIKGSLQTFLNAMTYPDKTVYPISSRNNQDFINLVRVYIDAVFNPLCVERENIFRQEGWHYELNDANADPIYKGVVYNEMKGAYSSSERIASEEVMKTLFPDNCYGKASGGDPDHIPELTYQQFCDTYHKYYNATNSRIFLDGKMDIENILGIIDTEYLSTMEMSKEKIEFTMQKPVTKEKVVVNVESTSLQDKTIVDFGYVIGRFDDYQRTLAFNVISTLMCNDNQSVLKKAIIDKGLGQDVSFTVQDGIYQPYVEIMVNNTNPDKEEEIVKTVNEVMQKVVEDGLNKDELKAIINTMEFAAKERDFGYAPKGIIFGLQALSSWLYGGDPVKGIACDDLFKELKACIDTDYYENLIKEFIINNNHRTVVVCRPSLTIQQERIEAINAKMSAYKKSLSTQEVDDLLAMNKQLSAWQNSSDTPSDKAKLPMLGLKDITDDPAKIVNEEIAINGIKVIDYMDCGEGINYHNLYFAIGDLTYDQLQRLTVFNNLVAHLPTTNHSITEINLLKKNYLGALSFSTVFSENSHDDTYASLQVVRYSCLQENEAKATDLVLDIMNETLFDDTNEIDNIVKQMKNDMEMDFTYSGHQYGINRVAASNNEAATCKEYTSGYEFFNFIKRLAEKLDEQTINEISEIGKKVFTKGRLTISYMGNNTTENINEILNGLANTSYEPTKAVRPILGQIKEGIEIASKVAYAEMSYGQNENLKDIKGKIAVIGKVLSTDYLWNTIRAIGGAYGAGYVTRGNTMLYYSYRDPNPNSSIDCYLNSKKYLEEFVQSDDDLVKYIIGTIGDYDPLLTNKTKMISGDSEYFCHLSYQDKCEVRKQMLTMSKEEIGKLSHLYDFDANKASWCVVGSKESIESCGDRIQKVNKLV